MKTNYRQNFVPGALASAIAITTFTGCKPDSVSQAEKADKLAGVAVPGIAETKAIAEEGFIYGRLIFPKSTRRW